MLNKRSWNCHWDLTDLVTKGIRCLECFGDMLEVPKRSISCRNYHFMAMLAGWMPTTYSQGIHPQRVAVILNTDPHRGTNLLAQHAFWLSRWSDAAQSIHLHTQHQTRVTTHTAHYCSQSSRQNFHKEIAVSGWVIILKCSLSQKMPLEHTFMMLTSMKLKKGLHNVTTACVFGGKITSSVDWTCATWQVICLTQFAGWSRNRVMME